MSLIFLSGQHRRLRFPRIWAGLTETHIIHTVRLRSRATQFAALIDTEANVVRDVTRFRGSYVTAIIDLRMELVAVIYKASRAARIALQTPTYAALHSRTPTPNQTRWSIDGNQVSSTTPARLLSSKVGGPQPSRAFKHLTVPPRPQLPHHPASPLPSAPSLYEFMSKLTTYSRETGPHPSPPLFGGKCRMDNINSSPSRPTSSHNNNRTTSSSNTSRRFLRPPWVHPYSFSNDKPLTRLFIRRVCSPPGPEGRHSP